MGKKSNAIDGILEYLKDSKMFKELVLMIKEWLDESNASSGNSKKAQAKSDVDGEQMAQYAEPKVVIKEVPVEKIIEKKVTVAPKWAALLENQYAVLQSLQSYPKLMTILNPQSTQDESSQLLDFTARSSQWDNIVRVWEQLAEQCKNTHQAVKADELLILKNCIDLYNRTLNGHQAQLEFPQIGDEYDYAKHTQLSDGDEVQEVLLPALSSPAKSYAKLAIVLCG